MSEVKNIPRLRFPGFDDHWRTERLGEISKFQNGVGHEQSIDSEGNIIVVNSKFISTEGEVKKYTHEVLSEIQDDSFSMVMSDVPNGKAIAKCYYFKKGRGYSLNQRICSIKSKTENNKFLFYQINRNKYYLKFDNGVGQTNLRKSEVLNCPVIFPSFPEQQKISDFLTAVDKRIELLEKKKTLLETYKKGVMKKIFNQEIRFKDDKGNDFPDWMRKKIEEITLRISTGLNPRKNFSLGNGDNYYVTIKNISNGKIDFSTCEKIDDEALVKIKNRSDLSRDDIIMSSIGNIGESYLLTSDPTNWNINESVFVLRPNQELINPVFFYYILTNNNANKYFLGNMTGSSFKSIKIGDLREMPVSIPSLIEQKKISKFLKSIDNQIELVENQIDKSKTWKKGLLQKMFV